MFETYTPISDQDITDQSQDDPHLRALLLARQAAEVEIGHSGSGVVREAAELRLGNIAEVIREHRESLGLEP